MSLDPQAGPEQAKRRPASLPSPAAYNHSVGLALIRFVTGRAKGYPFEVPLPVGLRVAGVVLADRVKGLNWRSRRAQPVDAAPEAVVAEAVRRLGLLLSDGPA